MSTTVTVLTATYNRKELLRRLYDSLLKQTDMNFEWVVIDDASTDGTEHMMEEIKKQSEFVIKYRIVPHGGKHRAINAGVNISEGDYIFMVDSDDWLPENSIEIINGWIQDIKQDDKVAAVSGICVDPSNNIIGEAPINNASEYLECTNLQRYRMKLMGDKSEVYKRSILQAYPFPTYEGEYFVTERMVWDRIAADGFKIRWYNVPTYIRDYQENGLSQNGANKIEGHRNNYKGYVEFIKQSVRIMEPMEAVTYFREYNDTAKIIGKKMGQRADDIEFGIVRYIMYLYIFMPINYIRRIFCGLSKI